MSFSTICILHYNIFNLNNMKKTYALPTYVLMSFSILVGEHIEKRDNN